MVPTLRHAPCLLLALSWALALPGHAAEPAAGTLAVPVDAPRFEHLGSREGLAQNTVNALFQDATGILWVGTQGGLHRYDGAGFLVYLHQPDNPASLSDSYVTQIAEDGDGRLWVGTLFGGVNRLDLASGRFQRLGREQGLSHDVVNALLADGDSVWVGSNGGLDRIARATLAVQTMALAPAPDAAVTALARLPGGGLAIGTRDGKLLRLGRGSGEARLLASLPDAPRIAAFALDGGGRLWFAAGRQLWFHQLSSGRNQLAWEVPAGGGQRGNQQPLTALQLDREGRLWLTGQGLGLVRLDLAGERVHAVVYRHHPELPDSLGNDNTRSLLLDRSGVLWLGTDFTGLEKLNLESSHFQRLLDTSPGRPRLSLNNIRSILETEDGSLWLGTEGAGLKSLDGGGAYRFHNERFARALGVAEAELALRVFALAEEPGGVLWIGTNEGLARWDRGRDAFRLFRHRDGEAGSLPADFVRSLLRDRAGTLWAGSDAGLARYRPDTGEFRRYALPGADRAGTTALVLALAEDGAGRIWIGTVDGLERLDPETGRLDSYRHQLGDPDSLSDNRVRAIHAGADGTLWIGTHSGLNRLSAGADGRAKFRHYLSQEGLANDTIYAILEDAEGRLWLSTNRGASRFEPDTGRFRQFDERDGLQGAEFNGGAAFQSPRGDMYFGGISGLNRFRPERIRESAYRPPLVLTAVRIGNRRQAHFDPRRPPTIEFDHAERVLGLEFAALDYTAPERNRYAYRLEGFDKDWVDNGHKRELTYTNLDPGRYRLLLKGANKDGIWSEQPLAVPIRVLPPPYRTAWAYALYALALLSLGGYVAHARRRKHEVEARAHAAIRESEERLKLALWGSGDGLWDWDLQTGEVYRSGLEFLGYGQGEIDATLEGRLGLMHPDDRRLCDEILQRHLDGQTEHYEAEYRLRARDGSWRWVLDRGKIVQRDAGGRPIRLAGTHKDVTTRKNAENELRLSAQVLSNMAEAVVVTDLDYHVVAVNPAFTRITGYPAQEALGLNIAFLNSPRQPLEFYRALRHSVQEQGDWHGELWQLTRDGDDILTELELNQVQDESGRISHLVGVFSDITDRKRAEQELRFLANYDTLTNLPNRTLFQERLHHALAQARRHHHLVALLFLDLDRFKHINDSLGHHVGDLLLKAVAGRLRQCVREDDTVARLGGDEFTIILEGLTSEKIAAVVAEKVLAKFHQPLVLEGREVVISPSIGVSLFPNDGDDATSLVKFADTAMYHAKELGRNNFQFYTQELNAYAVRRMQLETSLRRALDADEFRLVFQPKIALADGRVTGVETLIRWDAEDTGPVSPQEFIPLAEETGLIVPIGEWVLRHACQQYMHWLARGLTGFTIAVNLSARQFLKGNLTEMVARILADTGMPTGQLELELTESVIMENAEASITMLDQLKGMGLKLAVDDFGTGYSSLSYLKRFPIDTLKIDREFVRDISTDPEDAAITSAIVTLAHTLGLTVIAEGVENENQLEFLKRKGCDEVQGYYFSRPLAPEACERFLRLHGLGLRAEGEEE